MSNLPVQDTLVGSESKGLPGFFQTQFIMTEIIQALPTILRKNGATRVSPFAKLTDLQSFWEVTRHEKGILLLDDQFFSRTDSVAQSKSLPRIFHCQSGLRIVSYPQISHSEIGVNLRRSLKKCQPRGEVAS